MLAAHQRAAPIGSLPQDAIRIASIDHGDLRRPVGNETRSITHRLARRKIAQRDNPRAQREARLYRQLLPHFVSLVWRIERLVVTIEYRAVTHHVCPRARPRA